jgi:hypothetical protein
MICTGWRKLNFRHPVTNTRTRTREAFSLSCEW